MEITVKIDGRMVSVGVFTEVGEFWEQGRRNNRKLYRVEKKLIARSELYYLYVKLPTVPDSPEAGT